MYIAQGIGRKCMDKQQEETEQPSARRKTPLQKTVMGLHVDKTDVKSVQTENKDSEIRSGSDLLGRK